MLKEWTFLFNELYYCYSINIYQDWMGDFPLGFREVIPDQTLPEKWKELTLNTG